MPVRVDEMTTDVSYEPAAPQPAAASAPSASSTAPERARRAAERAERIARRTRAEGADD